MITGIELGPDSCLLVRSTRDGVRTVVSDVRSVPGQDPAALVRGLRRAREDGDLPAHARVVLWGPPTAQLEPDPDHLAQIAPLLEAGFEVDAILSPAQGLARLVNGRHIDTTRSAVAAISLNAHGLAIAIVSRGEVVSARVFEWPLGRPFTKGRAELLERYLVVSQVAPQVRHLIDLARPVYGIDVSSVLLCGNLPDLRSLAMLLIEEMDMEVDTLDSLDILDAVDGVGVENVPAVQLAAAVSLPGPRIQEPPRQAERAHVVAEESNRPSWTRPAAMVMAFGLAGAWALLEIGSASLTARMIPADSPARTIAAAPAVHTLRPEATMGRVDEPAPAPETPRELPAPALVDSVPGSRAVRAERAEPTTAIAPEEAAIPLPRVDGIMISGDRRLAIVGGEVVGVGDRVGGRRVARIDKDGVLLRDASGRDVHVAIRARK